MGTEEDFDIDAGWDTPEAPPAPTAPRPTVQTQSVAPDSGDIDAAWDIPGPPALAKIDVTAGADRPQPSRPRRPAGERKSSRETRPAELPARPAPPLKKARRQIERERRAHEKRKKQERKAERKARHEVERRERLERQRAEAQAEAARRRQERERQEQERREREAAERKAAKRRRRADGQASENGAKPTEIDQSAPRRATRAESARFTGKAARIAASRKSAKQRKSARRAARGSREIIIGVVVVATLVALWLLFGRG